MKITKKNCIDVLKDIRDNEMLGWTWDEDYYQMGANSAEERMALGQDTITKIIECVKENIEE